MDTPAVNTFSFVHGTDFQSACEILREGQVRPSPLPPGSKADPCVVWIRHSGTSERLDPSGLLRPAFTEAQGQTGRGPDWVLLWH